MKIELKNVSKKIGENEVLKNVNLEFETGKIYGLNGRNGSGKSMILKTICGFLPPSSGTVIINNEDIYKDRIFPDSIAALLDQPNYIPNLNAYDNLKIIANTKKLIGKEEIEKALEIVNLNNDKKPFKKFSMGMKQKLGIAQVLMEDPQIMLFDEPFNGIEEETTIKLRKFLKKQKGKIIIIASHIKEDMEELCDAVYKIDNGSCLNKE